MVAFVAIRDTTQWEGTLANKKGFQQQINDACTSLRCGLDRLFAQAFQFAFGNRRGISREARSAHTRFKNNGTLTARARKAFVAFFKSFGESPVPSTS